MQEIYEPWKETWAHRKQYRALGEKQKNRNIATNTKSHVRDIQTHR